MDAAYQAKYLGMARLLWETTGGDFSSIPEDYCEYFRHEYADGDISLVSLLHKFDCSETLEQEEIEEAIEILGKVNPGDWPFEEDIEDVSPEKIISLYGDDSSPSSLEFVEDNLSVGEKTERVLEKAISSVFGSTVSKIRNQKGHEPNFVNNFLQEEDGTFVGTFEWEGHTFLFEVFPDEQGWVLTYRMDPKCLDKMPPIPEQDKVNSKNQGRHIRHRGWK